MRFALVHPRRRPRHVIAVKSTGRAWKSARRWSHRLRTDGRTHGAERPASHRASNCARSAYSYCRSRAPDRPSGRAEPRRRALVHPKPPSRCTPSMISSIVLPRGPERVIRRLAFSVTNASSETQPSPRRTHRVSRSEDPRRTARRGVGETTRGGEPFQPAAVLLSNRPERAERVRDARQSALGLVRPRLE